MKKIFNKIKNIMGDYPRVFVFLLVLILIIVIFIIYRIADEYMNYSSVENEMLYTYVGENKYEFESEITINRKGVISKVEPSMKINWSSTPVFGKNKIILPNNMLIILPQENYLEYRLMPFTYIEDETIITKDFEEELDNYVIYDGEDTYLFSEEGTLKIGETEIKLDEYSYVICEQRQIFYLDKENNKVVKNVLNGDVTFTSDTYFVNLKEDTIGIEGNILSNSVEYVDFISNYTSLQK